MVLSPSILIRCPNHLDWLYFKYRTFGIYTMIDTKMLTFLYVFVSDS